MEQCPLLICKKSSCGGSLNLDMYFWTWGTLMLTRNLKWRQGERFIISFCYGNSRLVEGLLKEVERF
ncbi:hypothetical protein CIPAW_01G080400 [Carya illinoinensis]|uniref:Uncharacterized protein n=1 Tax=Carya illinoinensis TaxID=32201 RepID=A0A8T1RKD6_CARIL|nr:hypothetical protein CIPAW_01G080400 [Carya illinoinensis]